MRLSVVVLTKNEEKNIERALNSLKFCDEIIVVDDFSTDKTVEIAKNLDLKSKNHNAKLKIYTRELGGNFAAQRNFGLEKSRGDWVLFIDADEVVTDALAREIKNRSKSKENSSYYIKRRDYFWGREARYGEVLGVRSKGLIRLVSKNSGRWSSPVHEVFIATGDVGRLNAYLEHYPHQTIKEFLQDINFYSTLRAKELKQNGKKVGISEIIFWPLGKFLSNYFLKLGFLDGPVGFVYAFMMSFHSFLVRTKLFQYTKLT